MLVTILSSPVIQRTQRCSAREGAPRRCLVKQSYTAVPVLQRWKKEHCSALSGNFQFLKVLCLQVTCLDQGRQKDLLGIEESTFWKFQRSNQEENCGYEEEDSKFRKWRSLIQLRILVFFFFYSLSLRTCIVFLLFSLWTNFISLEERCSICMRLCFDCQFLLICFSFSLFIFSYS